MKNKCFLGFVICSLLLLAGWTYPDEKEDCYYAIYQDNDSTIVVYIPYSSNLLFSYENSRLINISSELTRGYFGESGVITYESFTIPLVYENNELMPFAAYEVIETNVPTKVSEKNENSILNTDVAVIGIFGCCLLLLLLRMFRGG